MIAIVLVGTLEVSGVLAALMSERGAPRGLRVLPSTSPARCSMPITSSRSPERGARPLRERGPGADASLPHGNPAWSFQWRDLIHGLRGSFRCIALDYPGFGLSTGPAGFGYTPANKAGCSKSSSTGSGFAT